jgi:hypothetical protein
VAFRRLAESKAFRAWAKLRSAELITGKSIEQKVEEELTPDKLRVEVRKDGRWVEESRSDRKED